MLIKSFVQAHLRAGDKIWWPYAYFSVLIGVCTDHDQPKFLCSRSDSHSRYAAESVCGHSGRLLTHYSPGEVRNTISKNPYRLSIEIFISIYIEYMATLLLTHCDLCHWSDYWWSGLFSTLSASATPQHQTCEGEYGICGAASRAPFY